MNRNVINSIKANGLGNDLSNTRVAAVEESTIKVLGERFQGFQQSLPEEEAVVDNSMQQYTNNFEQATPADKYKIEEPIEETPVQSVETVEEPVSNLSSANLEELGTEATTFPDAGQTIETAPVEEISAKQEPSPSLDWNGNPIVEKKEEKPEETPINFGTFQEAVAAEQPQIEKPEITGAFENMPALEEKQVYDINPETEVPKIEEKADFSAPISVQQETTPNQTPEVEEIGPVPASVNEETQNIIESVGGKTIEEIPLDTPDLNTLSDIQNFSSEIEAIKGEAVSSSMNDSMQPFPESATSEFTQPMEQEVTFSSTNDNMQPFSEQATSEFTQPMQQPTESSTHTASEDDFINNVIDFHEGLTRMIERQNRLEEENKQLKSRQDVSSQAKLENLVQENASLKQENEELKKSLEMSKKSEEMAKNQAEKIRTAAQEELMRIQNQLQNPNAPVNDNVTPLPTKGASETDKVRTYTAVSGTEKAAA